MALMPAQAARYRAIAWPDRKQHCQIRQQHPQEHAAALKGQMNKLKPLNGFLVPKEAGDLDVYDAVPTTAPGVSYLSLMVTVTSAKKA